MNKKKVDNFFYNFLYPNGNGLTTDGSFFILWDMQKKLFYFTVSEFLAIYSFNFCDYFVDRSVSVGRGWMNGWMDG